MLLTPATRAKEGGWDFAAYHVQIVIAIDAPGGIAEQLGSELPTYLRRRAAAALVPFWSCDVQLATGPERARVFARIAAESEAPPPDLPADKDKLLLAGIRWSPEGAELTAREFDRFVQRWSTPICRESRQEAALPEQLFALVWQTFSPLAQLEPDLKDPHRAVLKLRGASLPRAAGAAPLSKPGDVFLPILRRTTRGGELEKDGIQIVPWTYVETVELKENSIAARIQSASRRPFAARRQGRIEQVAVALRADADTTMLRLRSRTAADKPLVGYEVFSQKPGEEALSRIGLTDTAGQLAIAPVQTRLQFLLVKHGGQLLARVPIVAGAERRFDIPLPDDDARLAAETRLAAVREDLIDVVARRNILMCRARQKIQKKDYKAAEELMRALDDLPGRPQFSLTLTTAAQSLRSNDPQMQRRIDQLFEATQTLLTQYLDLRSISQLHDELREAQSKPAAGETNKAGNAQASGPREARNEIRNTQASELREARNGFKSVLRPQVGDKQPVEQPPANIFQIVKYPSPNGELAAYLTPDPGDSKRHAAIIWITGGDCNSIGDVWSPTPRENDQSARAYREAGIIMMFPSLRGGNDNPGEKEGFLGEIDDVLSAADSLQTQSYVDPKRIYLGGHSTGGTLVLLVAECSDRFRSVFSFGPAGDVSGYGTESGFLPFDVSNPMEIKLRSPAYWLTSIQSPAWVMEGTQSNNIVSLRAMAKTSSNPKAHFIEVKGVDHFGILAPTNEILAKKILQDTSDVSEFSVSPDDVGGASLGQGVAQDSASSATKAASGAEASATTIQGWTRVQNGSLSVEMPSQPQKLSKNIESSIGQVPTTTYVVDQDTSAYMFTIGDYPAAINDADTFLESASKGMMKDFQNYKLTSKRVVVYGKPAIDVDYRGVPTLGPGTEMIGYARLILVEKKLIILQILGLPSAIDQDKATRFWDTFSISEP